MSGHEYSFLNLININGVMLVKLRNPWGYLQWKGAWSFNSKNWTPELRKKFNYEHSPNDGSFYMTMEDFLKYFGVFTFCKFNPFYVHTSLKMKFQSFSSIYVHFKAPSSSNYMLSLYQQNNRMGCIRDKNYRYSPSRIIVMKIGNKW